MKFTKTLASIAAAAIAVSSLAVSAFAGSITFSDTGWWTQKDLKIEDILEGNKPEDVESITFTSDTTFFLGYNSTEVTDEKTGSTWKQDKNAADTYTVSDAVLASQEIAGKTVDPAFSVMLSKGDGVDYTINWKVNLKSTDSDVDVTPGTSNEPTEEPTDEPTPGDTTEPTDEPTDEPTPGDTTEPTDEPTDEPTGEPTDEPTVDLGETETPSEILPGESSDNPVSPDTGVALTFVPAALAAAALATTGIVLKKRSK